MTEDELKEIEERCNSATPGPWRSDITEDCDCTMKQQVDIIVPENNSKYPICWYATTTNTDFIVHARTDIPKLTAEVRRLNERDSDWHNLYMLQERYTAQYRLGSARMPQKILDGLKSFRRKLGIEFDILRDSSQTSTEP